MIRKYIYPWIVAFMLSMMALVLGKIISRVFVKLHWY